MKKFVILILLIASLIMLAHLPVYAFNVTHEITSAVNYAKLWSSNSSNLRNPSYPNWDNNGGDCCNFISQCLNQVMSTNNV